jgi:hypothetical protein
MPPEPGWGFPYRRAEVVWVRRGVRSEDHQERRVADRADLAPLVLGEVEHVPGARVLGARLVLDLDLPGEDDDPRRLARLVVLPALARRQERTDAARAAPPARAAPSAAWAGSRW